MINQYALSLSRSPVYIWFLIVQQSGKESNVVELGIKHIELNPTKDLTEEGIKYRKVHKKTFFIIK